MKFIKKIYKILFDRNIYTVYFWPANFSGINTLYSLGYNINMNIMKFKSYNELRKFIRNVFNNNDILYIILDSSGEIIKL